MPIRSQNVTAPQDRPKDEPEPKPGGLGTPKVDGEGTVTPPAKDDAPADDGAKDDDSKDKDDGEPAARHRSRVIALPVQATTDDDGTTQQVADTFGLEVESCEPTDTDYGDVAKFKVKASKDVLDELEERAHEALTAKRTVPVRGA